MKTVGADPCLNLPVNYTQKDPRTRDFPEIRAPAGVSQERSSSSVAERRSSPSQGWWLRSRDGRRTAVCKPGTLNHLLQRSQIFSLSPEVSRQTQSTRSCEGRPRLHRVLHWKKRFVAQAAAKASQREQRLGDAVRAEQLLAFTLLISGESELTMRAAARLQRLSLTALSPGTKCLFHLTSEAFALLREPT